MLRMIACVIILAAVCCTQVVLACRSADNRQNELLQLQVNYLSQEVEVLKNQSRENYQKGQMNSLLHEVEALKNQSKKNEQFLDVFSGRLYIPPHFYIYQLTPGRQSWQRSQQYCENWGGNLAVYGVQSLENRKILMKNLFIENSNFWIGAHDIASEGNWTWINGETASSSELIWENGQPQPYYTNEDCAGVIGNPLLPNGGLAHDYSCTSSNQGLCEKEI